MFQFVTLLQSALVLIKDFRAHRAQKGAKEEWITRIIQ